MTYKFFDLSIKRVIFITTRDTNKIINPDNPSLKHSLNYFENKYYNQLVNLATISKKNNIKLVLIKEPYYLDTKLQIKLKKLDSNELLKKLVNFNKENYKNKSNLFWIYTNALLNNSMDRVKKKFNEVIVVDPTDVLYSVEKKKNFLEDGNHLNNNGHVIVADAIYQKIKNEF